MTVHQPHPSSSADPDTESRGAADPDWSAFVTPASSREFLTGWLALTVRGLPQAEAALLFMRAEEAQLAPAARWRIDDPEAPAPGFAAAAQLGFDRAEVALHQDGARSFLAYPLLLDGAVQAVLAIAFARAPGPRLPEVLRQLYWAAGWIEAQLWRGRAALTDRPLGTAETVLQLLAAADQHDRFDAAALALVNAVPDLTGFDRAALGMLRGQRMRLEALSRAATFKRKAQHVAAFEAAMAEARAQSQVIALPDPRGGRSPVDLAHRILLEQSGAGAVVTVPLAVRGQVVGALTLLRGRAEDEVVAIDPEALEGLHLAAAAIAPVLKLKHDERRWISGRLRRVAGRGATAVLGRRPALSLAALAVVICLVAPFAITAPLRINADAVLQGREQRAGVALLDGFVRDSTVRAGDLVQEGQVLARLDDRDLLLERSEALARVSQALQASRDALAKGDRSAGARASADLAEARAALDLAEARLARVEVTAPMDGIVITGDLSQRLGAPVSRGDVLFEIARLEDYRVLIDISEYDLAEVAPGQRGTLVLNGLPGRPVPFGVTAIASVSSPGEGENRFRVEADVDTAPESIRPGMEGIAKIDTGTASLARILSRGTLARLRILMWRVLP